MPWNLHHFTAKKNPHLQKTPNYTICKRTIFIYHRKCIDYEIEDKISGIPDSSKTIKALLGSDIMDPK